MAVVIKGSGTITGVSVGGLPDGIVDTDMIADDAVTAAKRGTGAILQVVSSTYTTSTNNTTTTYADTGLTGTISISANSHVLVMVTQPYVLYKTSGQAFGDIRLLRASTAIRESNGKQLGLIGEGSSARRLAGYYNVSFLDEGASTGSNTYKTQMKVNDSSDTPKILTSDDSSPATMILMEVAA